MKILTLPLKRKWFEMIRDGVKLEEYREFKMFYIQRFFKGQDYNDCICDMKDLADILGKRFSKQYDEVVFTLGYPKKDEHEKILRIKNPKIEIRTGNPEWGAEPDEEYFVITWGKKL